MCNVVYYEACLSKSKTFDPRPAHHTMSNQSSDPFSHKEWADLLEEKDPNRLQDAYYNLLGRYSSMKQILLKLLRKREDPQVIIWFRSEERRVGKECRSR